jgi:CreA protein
MSVRVEGLAEVTGMLDGDDRPTGTIGSDLGAVMLRPAAGRHRAPPHIVAEAEAIGRLRKRENPLRSRLIALAGLAGGLVLLSLAAPAEEVGSFTNDWTGNGIVVEAIPDPKIEGITCHIARFDRGFLDKLTKGNWFEDPSNASISCRQTGPIVIGDIERDDSGEEVFSQRLSLIFKSLAVRRIYDEKNDTLVYVVYSRQVKEGSAKMSISTVALHGTDVTWRK